MTIRSLSLCILFLIPTAVIAQHQHTHRCATMQHWNKITARDSAAQSRMAAIERHTQKLMQQGIMGGTRAGSPIVRIPVVVHIVWNQPSQNLSLTQIQSQIDVLNEDFRRLNADAANTPAAFQGVAADIEVEFCLASVDPSGQATTGITRTQSTVSLFSASSDSVKFNTSGGKDAWPTSDYLNIWVAPLQAGLLGYAQFPGGPASTDGVVVASFAFGRIPGLVAPSNRGRTATHEVGHWLNLRHIWGDGPCGADDFVTDTPPSDGPNYGCQSNSFSCGSQDMVQNYMDYSDDACMNLFTQGQKQRMRALFAPGGFRESLLSSPGCGGTTPSQPAEYQVNQARSSLVLGGVQGTSNTAAVTSVTTNQTTTLQVSSNAPGAAYDTVAAVAPLLSASNSAFVTSGNQVVNVDITNPTFFFANSGTPQVSLLPFPGGFSVGLSSSNPLTLSLQMLVSDPSLQDGFALSQACQLDVTASSAPTYPQGPTGDDGNVTVNLAPGYEMNFYGTVYSQIHVSANGRVVFGGPDTNYRATVLDALSGNPFVGFWTDLDPSAGGSISIDSPQSSVTRITYNQVPYWGEPTSSVSFSILLNANSGAVVLNGLNQITANPRLNSNYDGQSQFLGMSRGAPGASFGGYSFFFPGANGGASSAAPMLFDWFSWTSPFGGAASLGTGVNQVVFTPAANGNYSWQSL